MARASRVHGMCLAWRAPSHVCGVRVILRAIPQPLVGDASADGYFYPALAGVANSVDFYPLPHTKSTDGCAQVMLRGWGRTCMLSPV